MALTNKLTTIANAIRSKTGKTTSMTLDEMPIEIENITTEKEDLLLPIEYPDYVRTEAQRVASEVRKVLKDDSIVSICMSDTHYYGKQGTYSMGVQNNEGCLHTAMATKALTYLLPIDFVTHLGDVSWGGSDTTPMVLKTQIEDFLDYLQEANSTLPIFVAIGNHDNGIYYHNTQTDGGNHTIDGDYLYNNFTSLSVSENTVFGGEEYGGYCYRDFSDKKYRVFLLNTSEELVHSRTDNATLGSQRKWLANALLELNNKSDATEWGFIVLCHYPADYGATMPLSNLLEAYVNGESISITDENGNTQSYNFSGKNGARFICQMHGHIHNFLTLKLHSNRTGSLKEYEAHRLCVSNVQYNRENDYGVFNGIVLGEDKEYPKTPDSAEDTSFVINVINRSEDKIYSFHYGAGYDRVIGIGAIKYYGITKSLSNVTLSNDITSIEEGQSYSTNITVDSGCELKSIVVTMNGIDITDDVYSSGVITISKVTGNISITVKAQARANFRNLVPMSINSDGTPYGTNGYTTGNLISSDGNIGTTSMQQYVVTGFIPIDTILGKVIRVAGEGVVMDGSDIYHRIAVYDSSFTKLSYVAPLGGDNGIMAHPTSNSYGNVIEENSSTFAIQIHSNGWAASNWGTVAYFRIGCTMSSANISPDNLIVTVDQEITYGGVDETIYFVTQNLSNVISSNKASSIVKGSSFETILTAKTGYDISDVSITMNNIDISSSYDLATGKVVVADVTGDIVIAATAIPKSYSITNTLSNVTNDNNATNIGYGSRYDATLAAPNGYKISTVKIIMNGTDVTSSAYTVATGKISIPSITGTLVITATAIEATYAVSYNLNRVTSSNNSTAVSGTNYSTTLTSDKGIKSVIVTMGGKDITSTVYNSDTGVISIEAVTGDIIITAEGFINLLALAVDLNGNPYNEGKGYKAGYRVRTSTGEELEQSGMYCSGFIPVTPNQTLLLYNVGNAAASSATGYNESYLIKYTALGLSNASGAITLKDITAESDGSLRITADNLKPENAANNIAYIRLSSSYLGDNTEIYVE